MFKYNIFFFIKKLSPHVEKLKSIKAIKYDEEFNEFKSCTLADLIYINCINESSLFIRNEGNHNIIYFKSPEWKEENPIFKPFKRIEKIKFENHDKDVLAKLNLLMRAEIEEVEHLWLYKSSFPLLEKFINPYAYHIIQWLSYVDWKSWDLISNSTLDVISLINPRKLQLLFFFNNWNFKLR